MADPILEKHFRAQVVLHGKSGLAEDVYVNSFVFANTAGSVINATPADAAGAVKTALQNFYTEPTSNAGAVRDLLAGAMLQPDATVKVYDLGKPKPRLPYTFTFPLGTMNQGLALPPEVALCLSYYATRSLPRRRGRIFLGPLGQHIVENTPSSNLPRPKQAHIDTVNLAATRLFTANGVEMEWRVLSIADQAAYRITGGWMDNAFDTQRRRGNAPTARTMWGQAPAQL